MLIADIYFFYFNCLPLYYFLNPTITSFPLTPADSSASMTHLSPAPMSLNPSHEFSKNPIPFFVQMKLWPNGSRVTWPPAMDPCTTMNYPLVYPRVPTIDPQRPNSVSYRIAPSPSNHIDLHTFFLIHSLYNYHVYMFVLSECILQWKLDYLTKKTKI